MQADALTSDPQVLVARLRERRLEHAVRARVLHSLPHDAGPHGAGGDRAAPGGRDARQPRLCAGSLRLRRGAVVRPVRSAQFQSGYAAWFRAAEHVTFRRVAGVAALLMAVAVALLSFLPGRERRERAAAGSCVAATGFTLMALQIFLLLAFQSVYGYVYTQLAILIGLFMAGIALGSWLAMRRSDARERLVSGFVSGHDFSRAADAAKLTRALAPARSFYRSRGTAASARDCRPGSAADCQLDREIFFSRGGVDVRRR